MKLTQNFKFMVGDTRQPLLSKPMKDRSYSNQKNDLQIRPRRRRSSLSDSKSICSFTNDEAKLPKREFNGKKVLLWFALYLGGGTLCFYLIRDQIKGNKTNGFLDAAYFSVVTMTTVGYGDLVPDSVLAKLMACVYVFTGMAFVGIVLSRAADYLVEKQEILMAKAINIGEKVGPSELLEEVEAHKVKYKFLMTASVLLMLIIIGILVLYFVEHLNSADAFYCVCSTITTLGYGDASFTSLFGRSFAIVWIISSTLCLAQFFLYVAELYTEARQNSLVKMVLGRRFSYSDLEAADLDHDNSVSVAEFIVYKLKEMGKISDQDISMIMDTFKKLDADHSGTLTADDLKYPQSKRHSWHH